MKRVQTSFICLLVLLSYVLSGCEKSSKDFGQSAPKGGSYWGIVVPIVIGSVLVNNTINLGFLKATEHTRQQRAEAEQRQEQVRQEQIQRFSEEFGIAVTSDRDKLEIVATNEIVDRQRLRFVESNGRVQLMFGDRLKTTLPSHYTSLQQVTGAYEVPMYENTDSDEDGETDAVYIGDGLWVVTDDGNIVFAGFREDS